MEIKKYNTLYERSKSPTVSVITSVYNRREILLRAMLSVASQDFKDIEYIVVNNGSTINIDDVVEDFMSSANISVLYIKRDNGIGPHTGKNSAIRAARGEFIVMLDSDDELLPNCISTLYATWCSIPERQRSQYREVVARCVDEKGNEIGKKFPEMLNCASAKAVYEYWHKPGFGFECVSMDRTDILKAMPFPEPTGVTWVVDSIILWDRLSKIYKSYFINDCLKRYYTDSADSITNTQIQKVTEQHVINMLYALKFKLNHYEEYFVSTKSRLRDIVMYNTFNMLIKWSQKNTNLDWNRNTLDNTTNRLLSWALYVPCLPIAIYYKKRKM